MKVLLFDIVLKERIWGDKNLAKLYKSDTVENIGEAWVLSGHIDGQSTVLNGEYKGFMLNDLYLHNKKLFGNHQNDRFPLLIKILDAKQNLSVQVHPNDEYALKHHNDLGKNECWYILDANKDAKIIVGHNAKNKQEFKKLVDEYNWDKLLKYQQVKKGDFYNISSGTVHGVGAGIRILEIQQSSNTTYRIYDYDRVDNNNNKRELHLKDALEVIDFENNNSKTQPQIYKGIKRLTTNKYFTVDMFENKVLEINNKNYTIVVAIEGDLSIETNQEISKLEKFKTAIITNKVKKFKINSNHKVFIVTPEPQQINKMYIL